MTTSENVSSPSLASRLQLRNISTAFDSVDGGPDSPDVGGRRRRRISGLGFELPPLEQPFTLSQLEAFLLPLIERKIRVNKIYQHIIGYQYSEGERVRNYPGVDATTSDTGEIQYYGTYRTDTDLVLIITTYLGSLPIQCLRKEIVSPPLHYSFHSTGTLLFNLRSYPFLLVHK